MLHIPTRTIQRFGGQILGIIILLAGLCLHPIEALAQTPKFEKKQQEFRKEVVQSWKWKPQSGVGLTTSEYARDYLAKYFDSSGAWKGKENRIASYQVLAESPLVLFQSESVDILVYALEKTVNPTTVVLRRKTAEILLLDDTPCIDWKSHFEFVDVDEKTPLELLYRTDGSCASQFMGQSFQIYELLDWTKTLEQRGSADWGGTCPKFMNQLIDPFPRKTKRNPAGLLTFEFRLSYRLSLRHKSGYCAPAGPKTVIERTCEYQTAKERFICSDEVVETHTMALSDIKTAWSWRDNAANIRWILDNVEPLRAKGFRLSEEFLDRLPRHLP